MIDEEYRAKALKGLFKKHWSKTGREESNKHTKARNMYLHRSNSGSPTSSASYSTLIKTLIANDHGLTIDAGCGENLFKDILNNVVGIDPENTHADIIKPILEVDEFDDESANIVLALGSIQFFNIEYVMKNFDKVYKWLKPGGLLAMRTRTKESIQRHLDNSEGLYHCLPKDAIEGEPYFPFHPWDEQLIEEVTDQYDLELLNFWEHGTDDGECSRCLLWLWRKK